MIPYEIFLDIIVSVSSWHHAWHLPGDLVTLPAVRYANGSHFAISRQNLIESQFANAKGSTAAGVETSSIVCIHRKV